MDRERACTKAWLILLGSTLGLALTMSAQVQTSTSTTPGTAQTQTSVERGEVVHVSGNDVVVKMEDGTIRDFPNVPEDARITVDGKELGVHDLKPGMKLEKTITTTTTPKTITTVQKVTGKVWHVTPPNSVILTLEDGTQEKFTIPKDQKFNIEGQMVDAFHLKKGMTVTATKVVEMPSTQVEQQAKVTGTMPPPPPAPEPDVPMIVAVITPAPSASPAAAPAEKLPNTASPIPLIGLFGILSLASSLGLKAFEKMSHRG